MRTPSLRRTRRIAGAAAVACALFAATTHAAVFRLDVHAKGFVNQVGSFVALAPTDPVSGTIIFQAANLDSDVTSIDFVDMTIGGHSYVPEEVAAFSLTAEGATPRGFIKFFGKVNDHTINNGTDDFWFYTRPDNPGSTFTYATTANFRGIWGTSDFAVSILAVPEPTTHMLLMAGLAALAWAGCQRRRG